MQVKIKFLGGAGTVTGSRFLIEYNEHKVLIDCGLFQGLKEYRLRNWDEFPIKPKEINHVLLTHAHLDHSGYLPKLVKEGYAGKIYCTEPTAELVKILLADSAKLQEEEAEFATKKGYSKHANPKPLYDTKDAEKVFPMLTTAPLNNWTTVDKYLSFRYKYAGHILGAAFLQLKLKGEFQEKIITISGDIGRYDNEIMHDPDLLQTTDILLLESTYGNRVNADEELYENFKKHIHEALNRKGVLLIPAFAVGRTQSILYYLCKMYENGEIPGVQVYADSPMAIDVTKLYNDFPNFHKLETRKNKSLFKFSNLHYIREAKQSKGLNEIKQESIIISASGMATGGRILHHLYHRLPVENNTVMFVGYQGEGTRGRNIVDGQKKIRIFGEEVPIHCKIDNLKGFSAHADQVELLKWTSTLLSPPKMTFLVHGEHQAAIGLKNKLEEKGLNNVIIPHYLESFELFDGL